MADEVAKQHSLGSADVSMVIGQSDTIVVFYEFLMNHLFARNPKEDDMRKSLELEVTTISKTIIENMVSTVIVCLYPHS